MQDFRIIYRILKILQQSLYLEEIDCNNFYEGRKMEYDKTEMCS